MASVVALVSFGLPIFPATAEDQSSYAPSSSPSRVEPASNKSCIPLLKACFAVAENVRSDCFYRAAHTKECLKSDAARVAMKRWIMLPSSPSSVQVPEPGNVEDTNRPCIANFDSEWSSLLVKGDYSSAALAKMEERLDACRQSIKIELVHP